MWARLQIEQAKTALNTSEDFMEEVALVESGPDNEISDNDDNLVEEQLLLLAEYSRIYIVSNSGNDCMCCKYCIDKKKYGGPGKLKKACLTKNNQRKRKLNDNMLPPMLARLIRRIDFDV